MAETIKPERVNTGTGLTERWCILGGHYVPKALFGNDSIQPDGRALSCYMHCAEFNREYYKTRHPHRGKQHRAVTA